MIGAITTRIVAAALLVCVCVQAQSTDVIARASSVTGRTVLFSGNGGPLVLTAGYVLSPGDRIDTRGGGRVVIDLNDGSMVVVQPESVIVLKDFRQASSARELFDIILGIVRVKINHFAGKPNPYRMNSPTASIAVRGTEFSIEVGAQGDTRVFVFEGAVEVSSLFDPTRRTLVEAGRGVLVQPGQDFHFFAQANRPGEPGEHNNIADRERRGPAIASGAPVPAAGRSDREDPTPHPTATAYDRYMNGLADVAEAPFLFRYNALAEPHLDSLENPAMASAFRTGEARLLLVPSIRSAPGMEQYASAFAPVTGRQADFAMSPQFTAFTPVGGSGWVLGGGISGLHLNTSGVTATPEYDPAEMDTSLYSPHAVSGTSRTSFYSGAIVAARRAGRNSFGLEMDVMKGTGSFASTMTESDGPGGFFTERIDSASDVSQSRFTAGYARSFGAATTVGLFYRYAFVSAGDSERTHTLNDAPVGLNSLHSSGHSSELGFRLRGPITRRLWYGATGTVGGISLRNGLVRPQSVDSSGNDHGRRGWLAFGLAYDLTRRALLSFDVAGGAAANHGTLSENATGALLQTTGSRSRFASLHSAIQADVTRRLFASASLLFLRQSQNMSVALIPDRFNSAEFIADSMFPYNAGSVAPSTRLSDFGVGWRFTPEVFVQYLYTTEYGAAPAAHTIMLRYTFRHRKE